MKLTLLALALAEIVSAGAVVSVTSTGTSQCMTNVGGTTGFTGGDGSTTATASATAQYPFFTGPSLCLATVTADLLTLGPPRPGFLHIFSINSGYDGAPNGSAFYLNGTKILSCGDSGCNEPTGSPEPLMLGTALEIEVSTGANVNSSFGAGGTLGVSFEAYELIGQAQTDSPMFFTPEPATWLLTAAGLAGFLRRRPGTQI